MNTPIPPLFLKYFCFRTWETKSKHGISIISKLSSLVSLTQNMSYLATKSQKSEYKILCLNPQTFSEAIFNDLDWEQLIVNESITELGLLCFWVVPARMRFEHSAELYLMSVICRSGEGSLSSFDHTPECVSMVAFGSASGMGASVPLLL